MNLIKSVAALGVLVLGSFLFYQPANAQSGTANSPQNFQANVAILNLNLFRREADVLKDIQAQVGEFQKTFREQVQKEEESLRLGNQELSKKRSILAPDAFAEERRIFEQKVVAVQRSVQERKRALDRSRLKAMAQVEGMLNTIVQEIAAEKNITLVLRREQTVFSSPSMEITAQVLEQINTRLPKVKVEQPGQ